MVAPDPVGPAFSFSREVFDPIWVGEKRVVHSLHDSNAHGRFNRVRWYWAIFNPAGRGSHRARVPLVGEPELRARTNAEIWSAGDRADVRHRLD